MMASKEIEQQVIEQQVAQKYMQVKTELAESDKKFEKWLDNSIKAYTDEGVVLFNNIG